MSPITIKIPARNTLSQYKNEAEKRRANQLRKDPLVIIITPALVECKRCESRIRLSSAYGYEPSHWRIHRKRCLRRTPQQLRLLKDPNSTSKYGSETPSTPSLISDNDDVSVKEEEESSDEIPERTRSPSPPPPRVKPLVCHPIVQDYLYQNHGTPAYPALDHSWRSWSWARIQPATFSSTLP